MTEFRMELQFDTESKRAIATRPIHASEFDRAFAATSFEAFRRGAVSVYDPAPRSATVAPLFSESGLDQTAAAGFCITLPIDGGPPFVCNFSLSHFRERARRSRAELIRDGVIDKEQNLTYRLAAYLDDPPLTPARRMLLEATTRLEVHSLSYEPFGASSAWDGPEPNDLPVIVARSVIADAVEEAALAPEREIGGLLFGKVCRDPQTGTVFNLVTGLAPGGDTTRGDAASVTFTPETFARGRRLLTLRKQGETLIGWYHSHPFRVCRECPLPLPAECLAKILFFSADDEDLAASTFAAPYHVALLAAIEPRLEEALGHPPVRLWGWRHGELVARGFHAGDFVDS